MPDDLKPIVATLKTARTAKGFSQRALAERSGVPQSHISRIESGTVDLQTSSLVQLARALDLEVSLVPRQIVPAVEALGRESAANGRSTLGPVLDAYMNNLALQTERAERRPDGRKTLHALRREIVALRSQHLDGDATRLLQELARETSKILRRLTDRSRGYPRAPIDKETRQSLDRLTAELRALRSRATWEPGETRAPRPAFTLDDEGDGDD